MSEQNRDRYITFDGLDCDTNATTIVAVIKQHIDDGDGAQPWRDYFYKKFIEQERLGVDDLFFVGSQMNNLFAYLDDCGDTQNHALLYQVEQECC